MDDPEPRTEVDLSQLIRVAVPQNLSDFVAGISEMVRVPPRVIALGFS
jgi:hypothetical protein